MMRMTTAAVILLKIEMIELLDADSKSNMCPGRRMAKCVILNKGGWTCSAVQLLLIDSFT
jgi:hypothetical protein